MANFIENLVRKGAGLHERPLPEPSFGLQESTNLGRGGRYPRLTGVSPQAELERRIGGFVSGSPFEPGSETDGEVLSNERGESRTDRVEEPLISSEYGLRRTPKSSRAPEEDDPSNSGMSPQEPVQIAEIQPDSPGGLSLSSDKRSKSWTPGTGRKSHGMETRSRTVESSKREPISVVLGREHGSEEPSLREREEMGKRTLLKEDQAALLQRMSPRPTQGASESQQEVDLEEKTEGSVNQIGDETGARPLRGAPEENQGEGTPIVMPQVGPSAGMTVERLMAMGERRSFRGRDSQASEASQNRREVRVSIGRIEIRTPAQSEATSDSPIQGFDHYLMERVYFDPHKF